MRDCQRCRNYKDCSGKPFFVFSDIRFCPFQIMWVIENAEVMKTNWPAAPDGSSYVEPMVRTGYRSEASYVKSVVILGEVNARLDRTGTDGKLLWAQVLANLELSHESKSALMYSSGWRRKRMSYRRWLKQRRYRRKSDMPGELNTKTSSKKGLTGFPVL